MMKKQSMLVRLVLGFLFVINALGHSSATDILGQKENQMELEGTRVSSTFTEKETHDGREAQYHVRKLGFGGKQSMVLHNKESNMNFSVKENGSEEGGRRTASKISAKNAEALNKSMERLREGDGKTKDEKSYKSMNSNYSQISGETQANDEAANTQKDEEKAKRSFQAEEEGKEVMDLIHMDYKGMARRKPPINNEEPKN